MERSVRTLTSLMDLHLPPPKPHTWTAFVMSRSPVDVSSLTSAISLFPLLSPFSNFLHPAAVPSPSSPCKALFSWSCFLPSFTIFYPFLLLSSHHSFLMRSPSHSQLSTFIRNEDTPQKELCNLTLLSWLSPHSLESALKIKANLIQKSQGLRCQELGFSECGL